GERARHYTSRRAQVVPRLVRHGRAVRRKEVDGGSMWKSIVLCLSLSGLAAYPQAIPRMPDGHPDLQGIWTNANITPLERPAQLAGKATVSDAEAAIFEQKAAKDLKDTDGASESPLLAAAGSNGTGAYNMLFIDRGSELARVDGRKRTSLIVDPPDGK